MKTTNHHLYIFDIEVDNVPSFVKVYINLVPKVDLSTVYSEYEYLISIPTWKYCFTIAPSISQQSLKLKLSEAPNAAIQWVEPLANGILENIKKIK
jgi:hypothetical protein